jgi:hypothetical protein
VDSPPSRCYTLADGEGGVSGGANLRFSVPGLAAVVILLAGSLLVACGGGGKVEEAPQAAATAAATPEEGVAGAISGPAEAFAKLESYRMNMRLTMEGASAEGQGALALDLEGAFVAPDRSQTHVNARVGELQLEEESISVGGQTWVKTGDNWVEGEPQFKLSDVSPASLLQCLDPEQLLRFKPSKETVNGVDSLRYSIDRAGIEALGCSGAVLGQEATPDDLPEDSSMDLWLAEDGGWPVRLTMTAQGVMDNGNEMSLDFSMDVTDVNAADIDIEPPA